MIYKSLAFLLCSTALLTACHAYEPTNQGSFQQVQATNTANRQLILEMCERENQGECTCFANELDTTLTNTEWNIFRAALKQEENPPTGTNAETLQSLTQKLQRATEVCSK